MQPYKKVILFFVVLSVITFGYYLVISLVPTHHRQPINTFQSAVFVPDQRVKESDCVTNGPLPDHQCTPGAIFATATKELICVRGYTSKVRNVSATTKNQIYAEYGITTHKTGEYEIDHHIPLELGGSNDIANLWAEAANPMPGFHQKDIVENYLHDQVCDGSMLLAEAQKEIAENWLDVWQRVQLIPDFENKYKY